MQIWKSGGRWRVLRKYEDKWNITNIWYDYQYIVNICVVHVHLPWEKKGGDFSNAFGHSTKCIGIYIPTPFNISIKLKATIFLNRDDLPTSCLTKRGSLSQRQYPTAKCLVLCAYMIRNSTTSILPYILCAPINLCRYYDTGSSYVSFF